MSENHPLHSDRHIDDAMVHPSLRPAEPDHPMVVEGGVIDGDTELMFRCMVEEYLMSGHTPEAILAMCRQPNYQAFHAAIHSIGIERGVAIVSEAAGRVGCHRVQFSESTTTTEPATLTLGATD